MTPLLVVWELATNDYAYFKDFLPAVRIAETCENRGIPLRFLFARDVPAYLDARPKSEPARPFQPCLIRGMTDPALIERLEAAGYHCVNGSQAAQTANDKLETARIAERLNIPVPRTVSAEEAEACPPDLRSLCGIPFPLVIKPRFGSRGRGVALVENRDEAIGTARLYAANGSRAVFQEYIRESRGRDLRVFFAGDRIISVAERINGRGALVANAGGGGVMRKAELPEPRHRWEEATFALAGEAGLRYGSADFLYKREGGLTLCEINAAPGFEALERSCGVDAAGAIIDTVMESFTKAL